MIKFDIPDPEDYLSVADWIELSVAYTSTPISKTAVSSRIESASGGEPSDALLSSIWDELEARMFMYGEHPPFTMDAMEVQPNINWRDNPEYVMLLILSLVGNPTNPTPTGKLFERISMYALQNYLQGQAIVTGHPAAYSVADICRLSLEKYKSEFPHNYNDRGVDVVAWKPFGDNRGNQLCVLMQCAGGKNWINKTGDVVARAWTEKYITFGAPPLRGFSTAVTILDEVKFEEVSFEADLLFDRIRLYINTKSLNINDGLRPEIEIWCNDRIAEYVV